MEGGYAGKILRVNLTRKSISTIPTEVYEEYGGGHGMGSAIFFDLVGDQLPFPAFDPCNLIIMMNHPFAGTFMPGSGRCEVQGLAPMLYPIEWFAHSNESVCAGTAAVRLQDASLKLTRQGIGKDLTEGLARAAIKWGIYEEDQKTGALGLAYWGTAMHYDPRSEAEWGFGALMGERDLMLHAIANYPLHWMPQAFQMAGKEPYLTVEQAVRITADAKNT
jgi:aldehyde:ferredoxin oxidoreductase